MGTMTKMPSPAAAHRNVLKKTTSETTEYAGWSGLHSAERPRNIICKGKEIMTVNARPKRRIRSDLLMTMEATFQEEKKKQSM